MKEKKLIQYLILIHWTFFWGLSVVDKIIPDVYPFWVGVDFYTLFVKFFASLGLTNPIFATIALVVVATTETVAFVCYLLSFLNLYKGNDKQSEQWFYRGVTFSVLLFSFFSVGDQVFGDRFNLLEHGIFWIISVISWVIYKYNYLADERIIKFSKTKDIKIGLLVGTIFTIITTISLFDFSKNTISNKTQPVQGNEVVQGVFKFDFPFLGDKFVLENTIKTFEQKHPELKVNYIYTGPDELNSKKATHILLYVFTEQKK